MEKIFYDDKRVKRESNPIDQICNPDIEPSILNSQKYASLKKIFFLIQIT